MERSKDREALCCVPWWCVGCVRNKGTTASWLAGWLANKRDIELKRQAALRVRSVDFLVCRALVHVKRGRESKARRLDCRVLWGNTFLL